jgi:hypothetical protein
MKKIENTKPTRSLFGWVAVIAGIVIFISGLAMRNLNPGTIADTRLIEGLGILITGWGIVPLVRNISAMRNPTAARRSKLDESDERATALRNQAAYIVFLFNIAASSIILVAYSAMTRGQTGFDPVWVALAFLVIAPILLFACVSAWQNRG